MVSLRGALPPPILLGEVFFYPFLTNLTTFST